MQIEIKIDPVFKEPKIIVYTDEITEEIDTLIKKISTHNFSFITGFRNETAEIIEPEKIFRIYSAQQKVFAITERGEFILRLRLYELEERLNKKLFVRISNSEIINLNKVEKFDFSFSGSICVKLKNNETVYVSRRYVTKIKKIMGI
jgi:DNA-binding LytR/AlgR family response regulator